MRKVKIRKRSFLKCFFVTVVVLALVRCIHPSIAEDKTPATPQADSTVTTTASVPADSTPSVQTAALPAAPDSAHHARSLFFNPDGSRAHHRIYSVPNFGQTFPDMNDVQLIDARRWGVSPVQNRADAEARKGNLVYVGFNPYYHVDRLHNSIPYLVPRAAVLLQDIGRTFLDSLCVKGIPLHKIIVTSVLRSEEDMKTLRNRNGNAARTSCHTFGTTFDVCYNRYETVEDPAGPPRYRVRNDTLKWVLAEVLDDMRQGGRCHVKYEVNQGCFHITVR